MSTTIAQLEMPQDCPIGPITAGVTDAGVSMLTFRSLEDAQDLIEDASKRTKTAAVHGEHPVLDQLQAELSAFFDGALTQFTVPIDAPGTTWESRVWNALREIPFGTTTSYGEIARKLDNPGGSRAVGLANGRNRVAILIPCHRVIASDGSLHGYASGLERKKWLLEHEQAVAGVETGLFGSCERTPS